MAFKIDWKWIISILVAILPFIYSMNFFQKDKELSYEVLQIINKKSFNGIGDNNIVFGIKDKNNTYLAENLAVVTIRFVNNGKIAIQRSDFDTPITIYIPEGGKVFQSQISYVKPKDLHIESTFLKNSIKISPMLLNPDDEFTISIILDGKVDSITPSARIIGVPELTPILKTKKNDVSHLAFFIGILFLIYLAKFMSDIVINTRGRRSLLFFYFPALIAIEFTSLKLIEKNIIFDINKLTFILSFGVLLGLFILLFHLVWAKKHSNTSDTITEN